jgi:hypothetical protein
MGISQCQPKGYIWKNLRVFFVCVCLFFIKVYNFPGGYFGPFQKGNTI